MNPTKETEQNCYDLTFDYKPEGCMRYRLTITKPSDSYSCIKSMENWVEADDEITQIMPKNSNYINRVTFTKAGFYNWHAVATYKIVGDDGLEKFKEEPFNVKIFVDNPYIQFKAKGYLNPKVCKPYVSAPIDNIDGLSEESMYSHGLTITRKIVHPSFPPIIDTYTKQPNTTLTIQTLNTKFVDKEVQWSDTNYDVSYNITDNLTTCSNSSSNKVTIKKSCNIDIDAEYNWCSRCDQNVLVDVPVCLKISEPTDGIFPACGQASYLWDITINAPTPFHQTSTSATSIFVPKLLCNKEYTATATLTNKNSNMGDSTNPIVRKRTFKIKYIPMDVCISSGERIVAVVYDSTKFMPYTGDVSCGSACPKKGKTEFINLNQNGPQPKKSKYTNNVIKMLNHQNGCLNSCNPPFQWQKINLPLIGQYDGDKIFVWDCKPGTYNLKMCLINKDTNYPAVCSVVKTVNVSSDCLTFHGKAKVYKTIPNSTNERLKLKINTRNSWLFATHQIKIKLDYQKKSSLGVWGTVRDYTPNVSYYFKVSGFKIYQSSCNANFINMGNIKSVFCCKFDKISTLPGKESSHSDRVAKLDYKSPDFQGRFKTKSYENGLKIEIYKKVGQNNPTLIAIVNGNEIVYTPTTIGNILRPDECND